jgi:hypothetical protein
MLGLVLSELWTSEAVLLTQSGCENNVQENILWLLKWGILKVNCNVGLFIDKKENLAKVFIFMKKEGRCRGCSGLKKTENRTAEAPGA